MALEGAAGAADGLSTPLAAARAGAAAEGDGALAGLAAALAVEVPLQEGGGDGEDEKKASRHRWEVYVVGGGYESGKKLDRKFSYQAGKWEKFDAS